MLEHLSNKNVESSALLSAFAGLTFYRSLAQKEPGREFIQLLSLLNQREPDHLILLNTYHNLVRTISEATLNSPTPLVGDGWQNYILDFILLDINPLSQHLQTASLKELGNSWQVGATHDLSLLKQLFDGSKVFDPMFRSSKAEPYPDWHSLEIIKTYPKHTEVLYKLKKLLFASPNWETCLEELGQFYHRMGCGSFASNIAFKWAGEQGLRGIPFPDPIRLKNLIGYEFERNIVISNTQQFLAGASANNILLYGDRGTGKSSTVKALLNEYWEQGLRIVEVPKEKLTDLPVILELLKNKGQKFIIFVDDLSFNEGENDYLNLKAVLEGSLEGRPNNVLIYATSNRRHLIKELAADRSFAKVKSGSEEFRVQDTLQEKLSLSDRFGITVIFSTPDQQTYLNIVEELAKARNLKLDPLALRQQALQWAMLYNGRSGRTARQFIDHLEGTLMDVKE